MYRKKNKKGIRELIFLLGVTLLLVGGANAHCSQCRSLHMASIPLGKYLDQGVRWGYIDCNGRVVVDLKFEQIFEFQDGLGAMIDGKDSLVVDLKGRITRFENTLVLAPFSEGRAIASRNGRIVIIDHDGNTTATLPDRFKPGDELIVNGFDSGLAIVYINRVGESFGFIDLSGQQAIEPKYDYSNGFSGGLATVQVDAKFGVINRLGEFIVNPTYLHVHDPSNGTVGFETAPNTWRFVDFNGTILLDNLKFENIGMMSEGMIEVSDSVKWGFINDKGEEAIPIRFDQTRDFSCGLAAVRNGNVWGFIDKSGKQTIGMRFDYVYKGFKDGLAYVATRNLEGYINTKGRWVWKRRR